MTSAPPFCLRVQYKFITCFRKRKQSLTSQGTLEGHTFDDIAIELAAHDKVVIEYGIGT